MRRVYLSLGSNMGDRLANLAQAIRLLPDVTAVASVYETLPQGKTDQPDYLNTAVRLETDLDPEALLLYIQDVEQACGRVRKERWGPRTLDIDIVLCGDEVVQRPNLEVPHPRMTERAFVLVPILELDPKATTPDGTPVGLLLSRLSDQGVRLYVPAQAFHEQVRKVQ